MRLARHGDEVRCIICGNYISKDEMRFENVCMTELVVKPTTSTCTDCAVGVLHNQIAAHLGEMEAREVKSVFLTVLEHLRAEKLYSILKAVEAYQELCRMEED